MSDKYTPTTAALRGAYVAVHGTERGVEFDRAAARIKADAVREFADGLEAVPDYTPSDYDRGRVDQRHQTATEMYEHADEIEEDAK